MRHLLVWAALALLAVNSARALDTAKEYEIKAVYLFNVGTFTSWPITAFASAETTFNLCVLGDDPFGEKLDFIVTKKHIQKRQVVLYRINDISEADVCHVLYISASEQLRLPGILEWLQGRAILTISDMDRFVNRGGMIGFYTEASKVRIALVPKVMDAANLQAGTNLMGLAKIIE